jgi:hypothetical protein
MVAMLRGVDIKEVPEEDLDVTMDEDMEEGEVDPPLFLIVERLAMCQGSLPNRAIYVGIVIA